jgi:hypothetical protein
MALLGNGAELGTDLGGVAFQMVPHIPLALQAVFHSYERVRAAFGSAIV